MNRHISVGYVKERPILMSAPMVIATLDDLKLQTRRIIRLPEDTTEVVVDPGGSVFGPGPYVKAMRAGDPPMHPRIRCPYGYPGDRLWVRETHRICELRPRAISPPDHFAALVTYEADGDRRRFDPHMEHWRVSMERPSVHQRRRPSILMPRWASRITLEITDVRVQRLQDISVEDIFAEIGETAESAARKYSESWEPHDAWQQLWDSIYGAGSWALNQWVWAITFKRIKPVTIHDACQAAADASKVSEVGR